MYMKEKYVLICGVVFGLAYAFTYLFVLLRLRLKFQAVYSTLGSPGVFDIRLSAFAAVIEFMVKRAHVELEDRTLSFACDLCLVCLALFLMCFILLAASR